MKKKLYQSKCLPDGAGQKKKKVSVFDEGTAAKLSAHLDLPKREKTSFKIYFNKKKNSFSQKIKLEPKNLTILTFMTFFDILDRDKREIIVEGLYEDVKNLMLSPTYLWSQRRPVK